MLFAAVIFGPLAALIVASASMLGDFTRPYLRWGIYESARSRRRLSDRSRSRRAAHREPFACDRRQHNRRSGRSSSTRWLFRRDHRLPASPWRRGRHGSFASCRSLLRRFPLYAPLVALLAIGYDQLSAWATMLFFVPALAAQLSLHPLSGAEASDRRSDRGERSA